MIICLDLGATEIKCALATQMGMGTVQKVPTNAHSKQGILDALHQAISLHMQPGVSGIAIASAGNIDGEKGVITYATDNLPGMTGFDFTAFCMEHFGLPVAVINDAHAALLGEMAQGAGTCYADKKVAMITLGSGVGGGYYADGKIVSTPENDYARFGHICLHPGGRECTCAKHGCAEMYLSGRALHRDAEAMGVDGADLFRRYTEGNPKNVEFVGVFRKNLKDLLDKIQEVAAFDVCIVGGGVTDWMGDDFAHVTRDLGYPIVKAQLGNHAGLYGALANYNAQRTEIKTEICICGGSLGGVLAAYSAAKLGKKVVLLEATDWIGGQLTSQAVPPDEHPWIEQQGCTQSYRNYRNTIRNYYRQHPAYSEAVKTMDSFCPADSEVSFISHPPRLALQTLQAMLQPYVDAGNLQIILNAKLTGCGHRDHTVYSVDYLADGKPLYVQAELFLDATDTGELLPLSGTAYVTGAESASQTGETHAPETANPLDMQPATYSACLENRRSGNYVIEKPALYEQFAALKMPYDTHFVFSMYGPDSSTGKAKQFGMFEGETDDKGEELFPLFKYRQIVKSDYFTDGSAPYDVSLLNWPQNDYFLGNLYECEDPRQQDYLARQFTLSFVYWLQTQAPRADGGKGYPWLHLNGEYLGTADGLTKAPYIRESRRIKGMFTVTENMVAKGTKPAFPDSVGVGSYPIDLHITTQTHSFFYAPNERFTIPLGAMIPVETKNLLPACKNIASTHLTNGCYRLHPVEWNVGEAAGLLAAFCLDKKVAPKQVWEQKELFDAFAALLEANGVQRYWQEDQN